MHTFTLDQQRRNSKTVHVLYEIRVVFVVETSGGDSKPVGFSAEF